jgi:hypothetical protein
MSKLFYFGEGMREQGYAEEKWMNLLPFEDIENYVVLCVI